MEKDQDTPATPTPRPDPISNKIGPISPKKIVLFLFIFIFIFIVPVNEVALAEKKAADAAISEALAVVSKPGLEQCALSLSVFTLFLFLFLFLFLDLIRLVQSSKRTPL